MTTTTLPYHLTLAKAGEHTMDSRSREPVLASPQPNVAHSQEDSPRNKSHPLLTSMSLKQMRDGFDTAADA